MPLILLLTCFIWITPTWEALAIHNRTANFSKDSRALSTPWGGWLVHVGWYNLDGHRWMLRCLITPSCMMVKHYNAPLLHFISFQVLGSFGEAFRRETFCSLGLARRACGLWTPGRPGCLVRKFFLNHRSDGDWKHFKCFAWAASQETGLRFFFLEIWDIEADILLKQFPVFHRGRGFPSSGFGTGSQVPQMRGVACQQLIVASRELSFGKMWQEPWWTETTHFGWIFLNCKIPRRQWNLQVLVTFHWRSNQYSKYSFQWNELHFRLGAFNFGVASPHCLDTGNLLLRMPASYASFWHTWKRSWSIYFKMTVLVIFCSDSKLSNYEWEKSKLSSSILPNIQLNVSGSIIF